MTYFIDDPRKWRLSKSGFSIRTGWAGEKKIIAQYPGISEPLDAKLFQEWMDNAGRICELHNATLAPDQARLGATKPTQDASTLNEWSVSNEGKFIFSNDFTHDVMLRVSGDFEAAEQRKAFAEKLAEKLNMRAPERSCYDGDGHIYAAVSAREASEEDIEFHKRVIEELQHENHNLNVALGATGYEEADWFTADERATSTACNELIQARIERMQIQKEKLEEQAKDAARLAGLRKLMGYVEDGSSTTVKLFQDDATKSFFVKVGRKEYFDSSFKGAIDEAMSEELG